MTRKPQSCRFPSPISIMALKNHFYPRFLRPNCRFQINQFSPRIQYLSRFGVDDDKEGAKTRQFSTPYFHSDQQKLFIRVFSRPSHLFRIKPQSNSKSEWIWLCQWRGNHNSLRFSPYLHNSPHKNHLLYTHFSRLNIRLFRIKPHSNSKSEET